MHTCNCAVSKLTSIRATHLLVCGYCAELASDVLITLCNRHRRSLVSLELLSPSNVRCVAVHLEEPLQLTERRAKRDEVSGSVLARPRTQQRLVGFVVLARCSSMQNWGAMTRHVGIAGYSRLTWLLFQRLRRAALQGSRCVRDGRTCIWPSYIFIGVAFVSHTCLASMGVYARVHKHAGPHGRPFS